MYSVFGIKDKINTGEKTERERERERENRREERERES